MKLKAVVTQGIPPEVYAALENPMFLRNVFEKVLGRYLKVESAILRPAEFYAQRNDETVQIGEGRFGVEVRLTGATYREGRDFPGAVKALHRLYRQQIIRHMRPGEKIQLFCVVMETERLHESDAEWIEGVVDP